MSRQPTLQLPEPVRLFDDPFWVLSAIGVAPLALLVILGADAIRYAVFGPTAHQRSIEIDVIYGASFAQLFAWIAAVLLAVLLFLSKAHATTVTKLRIWRFQTAAVVVLLALDHWYCDAVIGLPR
jgi:hypothetical protein